ncbi:unnamed protein product [Clonostachys rosea f. rosea IK726]|uniref:Uncharacterized protein n=1 Tax=Clonostachys rosea f. rosea IK726 TaxID=1349383 RepID=A0ACA9U7F1_BIOOC|nr:unnamed protein product [Clonostachys rosea f. rosea IK726]
MSPDELLDNYEGRVVPRRFIAGFVVLSYTISLIGAGSTLELINRRTGLKGIFNNSLLVGAAVTMGGVSIWSMHFVGNKAIYLGNGEQELQITFSTLFTVISFFVPIVVLLIAFITIGTSSIVSWIRVSLGGFLCGSAICGMHYLGNASIENYTCNYNIGYIVGSAIIAIAASIIALSAFFIFRSTWANTWWKRLLSALLLAGAVSGMHWCAAFGTEYTLISIKSGGGGEMSQEATAVVVICLAVGACLIIAGLAIFTTRKMNQAARRAQKITLGAAVFNKQGMILVDADGLIPSTIITDSFIPTSDKQPLTVAHPYFLWMFQVTRNWASLSRLMKQYAAQKELRMINNVSPTEEGGILFRSKFCLAAMRLAERLRGDLSAVGILWDEILPTGRPMASTVELEPYSEPASRISTKFRRNLDEKAAACEQQVGQGSLMFLVSWTQSERDEERLAMAGYRFAEVEHVSGIIASRMQIKSLRVSDKLYQMAEYVSQDKETGAHVRLGFFAIRARVNTSGFDVLVKTSARNILPSIHLSISELESWQMAIVSRFKGMSAVAMVQALEEITISTEREIAFISQLRIGINTLRASIQDPLMDDAILSAEVINLPGGQHNRSTLDTMLIFGTIAPIHSVINNPDYEYIPLSLFKTHQLVRMQESQLAFVQSVHHEFGSVLGEVSLSEERHREPVGHNVIAKLRKKSTQIHSRVVEGDEEQVLRRKSSTGSGSASTINMYQSPAGSTRSQIGNVQRKDNSHDMVRDPNLAAPSFGGIMVLQEIRINVEESTDQRRQLRDPVSSMAITSHISASSDIELQSKIDDKAIDIQMSSASLGGRSHNTFVDVLFQDTIESQGWKK